MAPSLSAQDTTNVQRDPWRIGGSIGVPGYDSQPALELFTISAHGTQVRPGRPGVDLFAGTMPRILVEGVLVLGARGGVVLPLALSEDVLLLPSGGLSLIAGLGTGGAGATPGVNVGGAGLVELEGSTGFRAGITWHWLGDFDDTVWLLEIGLVGQ